MFKETPNLGGPFFNNTVGPTVHAVQKSLQAYIYVFLVSYKIWDAV